MRRTLPEKMQKRICGFVRPLFSQPVVAVLYAPACDVCGELLEHLNHFRPPTAVQSEGTPRVLAI